MLNARGSRDRVATAVDLANTWRPIRGEDDLASLPQLRTFLDGRLPGGGRESWALTDDDLAEVRAVREAVRAVLERAGTDAAGAAEILNAGLRHHRVTPTIRRDEDGWAADVTAADPDRPAAHLAALTLGALAAVITTLGPDRLGVCAGQDCRATFADLSRNGSKQYCTRTCAHRAGVAAYRSRRRSD
ncbi:CGNR zinc finger domain-containing protein [Pseudonocardia sp. WMMC193]|uniref:CGNR zinc finger domain-containing protein n=1 Tax=Pseudonocardia sp. WMMC193 TaxID=2911965 RepID=UPI001F16190F|nr:CGNR zinc finger domain-containing protein [Pseudonocardia sp. WMMC193]MCF7548874.1 CGNR zinc finger domain-containing protein [Pseudonocardia sp. WMMC193]